MEYKIEITKRAEWDLDQIVAYIAVNLENLPAATRLIDSIENCYRILETLPKSYSYCHAEAFRSMGYRKAVIDNYLMIFRIDEEEKTVYILRFFYGAQDYEKLL
ncbi:type II toxin-antitoxin system RelE/ParE family toxin [Massiliimalia massiliensis]|uniref:type II toxin-antitoxin system RelE/ParE family toxin n=1 Tax=Massiliimalia massiliensis TaxID=1852384 RepID=UPI000987A4AE|nr:type II toxin-antitoxin system RelE/ParE family toxin [Massiliimalia massiliensis]